MITVDLEKTDVWLLNDPSTRLEIPCPDVQPSDETWAGVVENYAGFRDPILWRGKTRRRSTALTTLFMPSQQGDFVKFRDLLRSARSGTDGRLVLRRIGGLVPGVTEVEVCSVDSWREQLQPGGAITVSWTTTIVHWFD